MGMQNGQQGNEKKISQKFAVPNRSTVKRKKGMKT
jgi:hypothetical protein